MKLTKHLMVLMVFFIGTITNALAQGPEMNKVYTVPGDFSSQWNELTIPGNAFISTANEAVVSVTNVSYIQFRMATDGYGNAETIETFEDWNSLNWVAKITLSGDDLQKAANGKLRIYMGNNGAGSAVVTVINKDANYVEPTTPTPGGGGGSNDPEYTPDYTNQQDTNEDGVLEPCAEFPAFGALVDYNQYPQITEDIPTVYLTTDNAFTWDANTPKSEEYVAANIVIADKNGTIKQRNEPVTFRGRGNSTWQSGSKKKPWRLKFSTKTALLTEQDANFQPVNNYADAKSWTLLCNVYDKSLIRNAVSNELGKRYSMKFCPAYRFVDLVINGQYQGTYQISDHVQVDKNRVNVNSKTGWFVEFSTDKFIEEPYLSAAAGNNQTVKASIKSPEADITLEDGTTEYARMSTWLGEMWTNLCNGANEYNENRKADFKAFRDMVDMESLLGFVILQDLAGNYDGAMANIYAYKEANADKLKFGPLWDLDLAYGNYSQLSGQHFWEAQSQGIGFLFANMYKDPYFVKALNEKWLAFKDGENLTKFINEKIDALATAIDKSQAANYDTTGDSWRQWDNAWSITTGLILGHGVTNYATAISEIKTYIANRAAWLTTVYGQQYTALGCANLDPCADFGHNDGYVLQSNGTYKKGCDVCGTVSETDTQTYYQFLVYPESKKTETIMATSWEPSAEHPNSIAVVEAKQNVVEQIEGWNIIAGKKTTFADGTTGLTCKDFRLTDGHPYYSENKFVATTATYSRAITNAMGTICLPYKMQSAETADAKFYHFKTISADEIILTPIHPEIDGDASAYVPVVFVAKDEAVANKKLTVTGENVTVKKTSALEPIAIGEDGWQFIGTMTPEVITDVTTLKDVADNNIFLYYIAQNKFWRATGKYTNNPFRAYITSPYNIFAAGSSNAKMSITIENDDNTVTGISEVSNNSDDALTISRLFIPLPEGEYRIGGRKVIITK